MTSVSLTAPHYPLPYFGQLPPKLFTPMKWHEIIRYRHGAQWQNPDGEFTEEEKDIMLKEPGGALRAYSENGFFGTLAKLGPKDFLGEMKASRILKESVKNLFGDPNQDYIPYALNGVWMHKHDRDHLMVSELPSIKMGKHEGVNGVDGISARIAPHFHPEDASFKPKYPGMLDEYRVAIHQHLTEPSTISHVRLLFYQSKMIKMVPNPRAAIKAHKESLAYQPGWRSRMKASLRRWYHALKQFFRSLFRTAPPETKTDPSS